jgi:hypothetical protein
MVVRKAAEREGVLHPVSFRATTDLKEKLAKAASEAGRSLTQEIERRLERSFDHDQMFANVLEMIEENSQLQIQIMELQAELENLKGAGPDASDLEAIVERAVARGLEQALGRKDPAAPYQDADFEHEARQYQSAPKTARKTRAPAKTKA